jgi:rRNA maturation RNase YbeY
VKIVVTDRQHRLAVNGVQLSALGGWLMSQATAARGGLDCAELAIILTDHAGMLPVQRACFGKVDPTDVVSLRYDPIPPETGGSAEIVINVERAYEERRRAGGVDRELALYLAHGCQHLTGATDNTPAERAAMRRRENRWLRRADQLGYVRGLVKKEGP